MPEAEIESRGCTVASSDSQGVLAIWRLLADHGVAADTDSPPEFLADWRGDRLFHLACADRAPSSWAWVSSWRTPESASAFASRYMQLPPTAFEETELPNVPARADGRLVWIVPAGLDDVASVLRTGIEVRPYGDFGTWVAEGCFPQHSCNAVRARAADAATGLGP